jgi:hypothetical protein
MSSPSIRNSPVTRPQGPWFAWKSSTSDWLDNVISAGTHSCAKAGLGSDIAKAMSAAEIATARVDLRSAMTCTPKYSGDTPMLRPAALSLNIR